MFRKKNDKSKPVKAMKNNNNIGKLWIKLLKALFGKDSAMSVVNPYKL